MKIAYRTNENPAIQFIETEVDLYPLVGQYVTIEGLHGPVQEVNWKFLSGSLIPVVTITAPKP